MRARDFNQRVTVAQVDAADDAAIEATFARDRANERRCRCAVIVADVEPQDLKLRRRSFDDARGRRDRDRRRERFDWHNRCFVRCVSGKRTLHFFRLRRRHADAQRLCRLTLTLEQTQCCSGNFECVVVVEQRLKCRELARTDAFGEDLSQLAHACAIAANRMRHRIGQHVVRQRSARQQ